MARSRNRTGKQAAAAPDRSASKREPATVALPKLGIYALAAVALALVYLAVMSGHLMSMDGLYMERQAYALMFEHSVKYVAPLWTWRTEPTWNSLYGIGLSLLYLPGFLIAAPLSRHVPISLVAPQNRYGFYLQELYADPLYAVGGSWLHAVITALTAYFVARLVVALGFGRRAALWAMVLYGLGSSALVYSRGDFAQPLEGLCWTAALFAAVRYRAMGQPAALLASAFVTSYAILTRPVEGALLAPAVLAVILPARPLAEWRRSLQAVIAVAAAGIAGVAGTLLVNYQRYGNAFEFGYPEGNTWELAGLMRWLAVLVSPGRGILWEFPAVLFVPLGVVALVRAGPQRETLALTGLCIALLVNVTTWAAWWGGWCWGLRLYLPAVPLLAVLAGIGVGRLRRDWPAYVALAAGFFWSLPGVFTDILGGYGGLTEGVPNGWHWKISAYPPIGAWRFLRHAFSTSTADPGAIDILWFRMAPETGYWLLVVPAMMLAAAVMLALHIRARLDREPESPPVTAASP